MPAWYVNTRISYQEARAHCVRFPADIVSRQQHIRAGDPKAARLAREIRNLKGWQTRLRRLARFRGWPSLP